MVASGFNYITDLYDIHNITQNTMLRVSKDVIIATLREYFSKDSYYHYVADEWGFPKTPDHTDLAPDAGISDNLTTRLYIGEAYRFDTIYYPAILVRAGNFRYQPIAFNREYGRVDYEAQKVIDGYGNETIIAIPSVFVTSGAWEGDVTLDILTRGSRSRDDLAELVSILFTEIRWSELFKVGIAIKPTVATGSPTESEDRNDKLFKISVTLNVRTEWSRQIPVESVLDIINICTEIGNLQPTPALIAPNLDINTQIDLLDEIENI